MWDMRPVKRSGKKWTSTGTWRRISSSAPLVSRLLDHGETLLRSWSQKSAEGSRNTQENNEQRSFYGRELVLKLKEEMLSLFWLLTREVVRFTKFSTFCGQSTSFQFFLVFRNAFFCLLAAFLWCIKSFIKNQSINGPINQSMDQSSMDQSINQLISPVTFQVYPINQSTKNILGQSKF